MLFLHTLRNTAWLARWALLWFAGALGVAVASPLVNPQEELILCTSVGMVKAALSPNGSLSSTPVAETHGPLCLVSGVPPSI